MEKKQKNYLIVVIITIMVIIFISIFLNRENIFNKPQNNSITYKNSNSENRPVIGISQSVSPSPTIEPIVTLNPKPSGCKEIYTGNKVRKEVALTFDAGSGTGSAEKILKILEENNLKSTFFLTGKWAEQNTDLVKKISNEGHEIFNHTYSHPDLTKISEEEIKNQFLKTENIIYNLTGRTTHPFFRPPYGAINKAVIDFVCAQNYQAIMWTVDALDWKEGTSAETAISRVFAKEQNGEIILMHVGDNLSAEILPDIIQRFLNDGYKIVSLSDLMRD